MVQVNQMNVYQFSCYILDPNTVRLMKQGQGIEVEPQVFETLLLLVKNSHRVITKDELMQDVWNGRMVTDNVITRTIYEIRKIIDSADHSQSMIRTVRGKGYQFIAEVKLQTALNNSEANAPDKVTKKNGTKKIMLLVLVMLLGFVLWNQNQNQIQQKHNLNTPEKVNTIYPVVAVLPISVEIDSEELSMLLQSLIDYLTNQLVVNLNMKVIHPDSLVNMGDQFNDIRAIQKATRADFIIQGYIESVTDQSVYLHLTLYKYKGADELTTYPLGVFKFPYPKNAKELNDLYKQRKLTVRSIVKIIKPGMTVNHDGNFETEDPEAYRLVIAAHHISRTDDCKDMERAEQLLLNAVKIDDQFVYAYQQLFTNYYKRVWICGESTDFHAKGLAMAEIVDRLAPNLHSSAIDIRRSTILVESNQVEQAYEFSKNADWNNPDSIYNKSYSLRYAGFLNEASHNLDRILQLDPFFFNEKPIQQAPNTLLYQNRFAAHLLLLAEPGNSYHDYFRGLNLFLTDKVDQARSILQGVVKRTPNDLFGQFSQALMYIIENDDSSAVKVIDKIVQLRKKKNHTDGEMTYKLVQLYALAGAQDLALQYLQVSVDQGFFPMNYFLIDPALKSIQKNDQFLLIVDQATQRHEAFAKRFGLKPETMVGLNLE